MESYDNKTPKDFHSQPPPTIRFPKTPTETPNNPGNVTGMAQKVGTFLGFGKTQPSAQPVPPSVHLGPSHQGSNKPTSLQSTALASLKLSQKEPIKISSVALKALSKSNPLEVSAFDPKTPTQLAAEHQVKEEQEIKVRESELTTANYISEELASFAPNLSDPNVSLHSLLKVDISMQQVFSKKAPLKLVQKSEIGCAGKVKFVQFRDDPNTTRSYAIKRSTAMIKQLSNYPIANLEKYHKNLAIARKVCNHSNFMKVHGVILKTKVGKKSKPYLIMEHIEGTPLGKCESLSMESKEDLMKQLKNAFLHLYDLKILPLDFHPGNVIITSKNELKLIDFDEWRQEEGNEQLVKGLYRGAFLIATCLGIHLPALEGASRADLEKALTYA